MSLNNMIQYTTGVLLVGMGIIMIFTIAQIEQSVDKAQLLLGAFIVFVLGYLDLRLASVCIKLNEMNEEVE